MAERSKFLSGTDNTINDRSAAFYTNGIGQGGHTGDGRGRADTNNSSREAPAQGPPGKTSANADDDEFWYNNGVA